MNYHETIIHILLVLAGAWCGYASGWYRACNYRDKLETRFPRTRA